MTVQARTALILLLAALGGCEEWPPQGKELTERFQQHRQGIEQLKATLEASEYWGVSVDGFGVVRGEFFEGELVEGTIIQEEYPEHSEQWGALLSNAGVDSIGRLYEGGVSLAVRHNVRSNRYESFASFIFSSTIQEHYRVCDERAALAECGYCVVRLADDWWLKYGWWPRDYDGEAFEELRDGKISPEEYDTRTKQVLDKCFESGGTLNNAKAPG